MDAPIAFEHLGTERRQDRSPTPWTARSSFHDGSMNARLMLSPTLACRTCPCREWRQRRAGITDSLE